jgi:hypothetical protein
MAAGLVLITIHPRYVLVALAYSYLLSAFAGMAITRVRQRGGRAGAGPGPATAVHPATPRPR